MEDLPKDEARYAVKHIGYTTEDGGQRTKLVFVAWIPADSSVKTKMLHASSLAPLKQALNGIAISLQGHTLADLQFDDVSIFFFLMSSKLILFLLVGPSLPREVPLI